MTSTMPQTTMYQANPTVNPSNSDSCQVTIPDYSVLRQTNIDKINEFYNSLLNTYTQNYSDYTKGNASSNINDRTNATTILKPKVQDANTQILNLSQTMINSVNQDTDLINAQKNTLTEKMSKIDSMISNLSLLKDKDNEMTVLSAARDDSLSSTQSSTESMQFTTYIYIGICILITIIIVGLIIYLVYSSSFDNKSANKNNNIHKNIAVNK
jgi:hypothetical protein